MKNKIAQNTGKRFKYFHPKRSVARSFFTLYGSGSPGNPEHGDYAANVALILAAQAKQNPRKIAQIIQENLSDPENIIEKTQIAGPGFINFFIKDSIWHQALRNIDEQKKSTAALI
jgi:arginyl-tRNA synthetase